MLSGMRKLAKDKTVAIAVMGSMVMGSVVTMLSLALTGKKKGGSRFDWILNVEGSRIGQREFVEAYYNANAYFQRLTPQALLDDMAKNRLKLNLAEKIGVQVGQDYVISGVLKLGSKIDPKKLEENLLKSGRSQEDLENDIKERALVKCANDIYAGTLHFSKKELEREYIKGKAKKKFRVLSLDIEKYVEQERKNIVSEEEVKAFFENNRSNYMVQEKRSGTFWKFIDPQQAKDSKFDEDFTARAKDILENGSFEEDFKNFVKNFEGEESKVEKIDLKYSFPELKLFMAKNIGEKDFYVADGVGYIVRLDDIEAERFADFGEVENAVKKDLFTQKAQVKVKEDLEKLKKNPNDLSLIKSLNVIEHNTDFIVSKNDLPKDSNIVLGETATNLLYRKDSSYAEISGKYGILTILKDIDLKADDVSIIKENRSYLGSYITQNSQGYVDMICDAQIKDLKASGKIKVNEKSFNDIAQKI